MRHPAHKQHSKKKKEEAPQQTEETDFNIRRTCSVERSKQTKKYKKKSKIGRKKKNNR
jgi:hypothetical protein